jgi:hypothetical protein
MPDDESAELPHWLPGVTAAASIVGAFFPPTAPLSAGLQYLDQRRARQTAKLRAMGDAARDAYGGTLEQLLDTVNSDERLQWMLDTAMDAASRAATLQKTRALGRALAEGALVSDDARLDQAALMMRIISDVEPIDCRVLALFSDLRHGRRDVPPEDLAIGASSGFPACLYGDAVAGLAGIDPVVLDAPLGVLRRHGLIAQGVIDANRGAAWCITDLGERLLDYLQENRSRDA